MTNTEFPALNGQTVTERHARECRENGHAAHIVDGVDQDTCPRCGEITHIFRADDRVVVHSVKSVFHHMTGTVLCWDSIGVTTVQFDGRPFPDDVLTVTLFHLGAPLN